MALSTPRVLFRLADDRPSRSFPAALAQISIKRQLQDNKSWYDGQKHFSRMKVNTAALALRPLAPALRPLPASSSRFYATQNSLGAAPSPAPRRRTVTAFNDDGFVPWNELSAGEKASRATQQSFNFGVIIAGMVATVRDTQASRCTLRWNSQADAWNRAPSVTSYGRMSSRLIVEQRSSTERSTESSRMQGVLISWETPKRSRRMAKRQ